MYMLQLKGGVMEKILYSSNHGLYIIEREKGLLSLIPQKYLNFNSLTLTNQLITKGLLSIA